MTDFSSFLGDAGTQGEKVQGRQGRENEGG